jgi:hypothetical protein
MKHSRFAFSCHLLRVWVISLFALAIAHVAVAQEKTNTQMPGPEHKKLGFLVGTWKIERTMKKSPYQPVEERRMATQTGEWFDGNFWMLCRFKESRPTGPYAEVVIFGYDSEAKIYSCHVFTSTGQLIIFTGTVAGNTWTFLNDSKEGGKSYKLRWTIVEESPTTGSGKFELSEDGGPWTLLSESRRTKM